MSTIFGNVLALIVIGVSALAGINSKKSERTEEKLTEQLAEIAQNQALMVMCLQ